MVIKHFIAVLCSLQQEYGGISYTSHISWFVQEIVL